MLQPEGDGYNLDQGGRAEEEEKAARAEKLRLDFRLRQRRLLQ